MKKFFLFFMIFALCSALFTSCSKLDNPANAKRIGSGYIEKENNICFVEVDGIRYSPISVYTNNPGPKESKAPIVGEQVTIFTLYEGQTVEFIAGDLSEEYLEEYFTSNTTFAFAFAGLAIISVILIVFIGDNQKP